MNKQNVVSIYSEILFGHKKEWNSDTCYNMDEPWKHYAKWNKPDTKGQVWLHLSEGSRIGKFTETESKIEVTWGLGKEGMESYCSLGTEFLWGWWRSSGDGEW